jgi:hypothetical protein
VIDAEAVQPQSAKRLSQFASQPEVAKVWLSSIEGRSKRRPRAKAEWFCVWGVVAIFPITLGLRRSSMWTARWGGATLCHCDPVRLAKRPHRYSRTRKHPCNESD